MDFVAGVKTTDGVRHVNQKEIEREEESKRKTNAKTTSSARVCVSLAEKDRDVRHR